MREFVVDPTDTTLRGLPKYYGDLIKNSAQLVIMVLRLLLVLCLMITIQ